MWKHKEQLSRLQGFDAGAVWRCRSMMCIDRLLTCKVCAAWLPFTCCWLLAHARDLMAGSFPQVFGFKTVDDYYSKAESFQYIPSIRTPCLFLMAKDDPFVRWVPCWAIGLPAWSRLLSVCLWCMRRELPVQDCRQNPHTVLAVTETGGHCGHLQGLWPLGRSFLDDTAIRFCRAMLSNREELKAQ